jgi:hypothetical protein
MVKTGQTSTDAVTSVKTSRQHTATLDTHTPCEPGRHLGNHAAIGGYLTASRFRSRLTTRIASRLPPPLKKRAGLIPTSNAAQAPQTKSSRTPGI